MQQGSQLVKLTVVPPPFLRCEVEVIISEWIIILVSLGHIGKLTSLQQGLSSVDTFGYCLTLVVISGVT